MISRLRVPLLSLLLSCPVAAAQSSDTHDRCVKFLVDWGNPGECLEASSTPTFGQLAPYPGLNNVFSGSAVVAGGQQNTANGAHASIVGGQGNFAVSDSFVGGGQDNSVNKPNGCVMGGTQNRVVQHSGTIGGGSENTVNGSFAFVGGGFQNAVKFRGYGVIGGGMGNTVESLASVIGGGSGNKIEGFYFSAASTIGGGSKNTVIGDYATVGGGKSNRAGTTYTTVAGGRSNAAHASWSAVGGGNDNLAAGYHATVPGGRENSANADYSFAAGRQAKANHSGSFVWGDANNIDKTSSRDDEFNIYARGGVRIFTNAALTAGVLLAPGGGSWSSVSDRRAKENLEPVDAREVLRSVLELPISVWNYKTQADSVRHMGPMAQDFRAAFGLGVSDQLIDTVDPDGVALAAIQGLDGELREELERRDEQIAQLETELAGLRSDLADLRSLVTAGPSARAR